MFKKAIKTVLGFAATATLGLALVACGGNNDSDITPTTTAPTNESGSAGGTVIVAGSTTVAPVAQALADAFMAAHSGYTVEVQSMGTGAGMTAAIEGVADIGLASRNLNADELVTLDYQTFAIDGIVVITHESNPVSNLTYEQIRNIFLGNITNWSEVGGNNASIIVISRESGSGARGSFEYLANVVDDVMYDLIGQGSNGVLTSVEANANAIGYVTYGLVAGRRVSAVSVDGTPFSGAAAANGSYPFAIGFHMAFQQSGVNAATQTFLDWAMSSAGQAVVAAEEYVPAVSN